MVKRVRLQAGPRRAAIDNLRERNKETTLIEQSNTQPKDHMRTRILQLREFRFLHTPPRLIARSSFVTTPLPELLQSEATGS
jgi:hypothetical protein